MRDEVALRRRRARLLRGGSWLLASAVLHVLLIAGLCWATGRWIERSALTITDVDVVEVAPPRPRAVPRPAASAPPGPAAPPTSRAKASAARPPPPVELAPIELAEAEPVALPAGDEGEEDGAGDAGGGPGGAAGGAGGGAGGVGTGSGTAPAATAPGYDAAYLHNPPPQYPAIARRMRLQGTTTLRVLVSPEGRPQRVAVENSSGTEVLDEAALEAVRQWTFVPARQGAKAVAAEVDVPLRFRLSGIAGP